MTLRLPIAALLVALLTACSSTPVQPPSAGHLRGEDIPPKQDTASIPPPIQVSTALPKPKPAPKVETYSVVVNNVRVQDLLFALARDAKINVDIHPGIAGSVTLNAIDQTLHQLLTRISKQVDMRWEIDGANLMVMPDSPFLRTYKVDYVNMSRDTTGSVTVTTQIASTGAGASIGGNSAGGSSGGNNSLTKIDNKATHHFWETLEKNIKDILRETDKILPEGSSETVVERLDQQSTTGTGAQAGATNRSSSSSQGGIATSPNPATVQQAGTTVVRRATFREAASVIVNAESGVVTIRATSRQHEKIQEFLDHVLASSKRQVLIEATIAEVTLSDQYQQGIDWSRIRANGTGLTFTQTGKAITGAGLMTIAAKHINTVGSIFTAGIRLLETFGDVRVISSPKLSVINNQTAVLKVVDNLVYFTIKADTTSNANTTTTTYTSNLFSVPVGLVMNVTPQISESDSVLLNIRPSISRKFGEVDDPNPALAAAGITSKIPVIRTREMESMIQVDSGNIVVMGGLMEDSVDNTTNAVPGVSAIPLIGNIFKSRDDLRKKTELVVFLRPVVVKNASIQGDYSSYRDQLPRADFFDTEQSKTKPANGAPAQ